MANRPTRFYSNRQETKVAKAIGGKKNANSGATSFIKGDVSTKDFLIECKTCVEPRKSVSIKKDWLTKNQEEAYSMHKSYSALAFDFGDNEEVYYVINEKLMKLLIETLQED